MATTTVPSTSFPAQPPATNNLDTREIAKESVVPTRGCHLHMAIIQRSVRRWEKPWRHQRAIVLFANSAEETKLRILVEGRIKAGEYVLQQICPSEWRQRAH
jgi:hypothetical protein